MKENGRSKDFQKMLILFAFEGFFMQYLKTMNYYSNNLYATNLNATDGQIGLLQLIPNVASCILFLPLGALADRQKSSKTLPFIISFVLAGAYFLLGLVPSLPAGRMGAFLALLPLSVGGVQIYIAQWQNFFGDAVEEQDRNGVYTFRNRFMFLVAILGPMICGFALNGCQTNDERLAILRMVYFIGAAFAVLQGLIIARVPGGVRSEETMRELEKNRFSVKQAADAIAGACRDKDFLLFLLPVMYFYLSWHIDWSMWYIGQTQYVLMNPMHLSIHTAVFNIGQLIAVGIAAKIIWKKSVHFGIILAAIGMTASPCVMIVSTFFSPAVRPFVLIFGCAILNCFQCAIELSTIQMLLQAVPAANKGLLINLYNMLIVFSNGLLPWIGVKFYTAIGADYRAFVIFFGLNALWRLSAVAIFVWRYLLLKRQGKLFSNVEGKTE